MAFKTKLSGRAEFYNSLWDRNKGIFFRGTSGGKGIGFGALGKGTYVSWDEGVAKAFAKISSEKNGGKPQIQKIHLDKNLNLLDSRSKVYGDIKRELGVQPYDKIDDPFFASLLTEKVKEKGFDGVISDDRFDGIVVFNKQ